MDRWWNLPTGSTETGTWAFTSPKVQNAMKIPISFLIPLAAGLIGGNTHFVPEGGEGVCNGTAAEPKAPVGVLCVYKQECTGVTAFGTGIFNISGAQTGTGKTGAFIVLEGATATSQAYGTWAVTGG